jgi:anti-anti-sigma factor
MKISTKEENGVTVLQVSGRLDAVSAEAFGTECRPCLAAERQIVLDLSALEYISSAGIRAILLVAKELKEIHGGLAIAGLKGMVREVFTITNLDQVFPVFETVSEAASTPWGSGLSPQGKR